MNLYMYSINLCLIALCRGGFMGVRDVGGLGFISWFRCRIRGGVGGRIGSGIFGVCCPLVVLYYHLIVLDSVLIY